MTIHPMRALVLGSALVLVALAGACGGGGGGDSATLPGDATLAYGYKSVGADATYYVFHNADSRTRSFTADTDLSTATLLADGATAGLTPITTATGVSVTGSTVTLQPLTSAIFRK
ncbi:MAG: hypothetical protein Q8K67_01790 [Geothrix sp.]|nr:hypothetical protein [Geothrix sp.]